MLVLLCTGEEYNAFVHNLFFPQANPILWGELSEFDSKFTGLEEMLK